MPFFSFVTWFCHPRYGFIKNLLFLIGITCSGQLHAASELFDSGDELVLRNTRTAIHIRKSDFALTGIVDLPRNENYVTRAGGNLFAVSFWNRDTPGKNFIDHPKFTTAADPNLTVYGDHPAKRDYSWKTDENGRTELQLHWLGNRIGNVDGAVDVTVSVALDADDPVAEWQIGFTNGTPLDFYEIQFPVLNGLGASLPETAQSDYLVAPVNSGQYIGRPRENANGIGYYPNCMSLQLVAYCDGQGGSLYFAAHDPQAFRKQFFAYPDEAKQTFTLKVHQPADRYREKEWKLAFPYKIGPIAGDWYDVAKYYRREFAKKNYVSFDQRDVAPWLRNLNVWVQGAAAHWDADAGVTGTREEMSALEDRLLRFRDALGEDFGFHWYVWYKHVTFDAFYPDYLPARDGFREIAAHLKGAGVHCMPYINFHYFDTRLPEWESVSRYAVKELDPDRSELWYNQMQTMCIGTKFWQNDMTEVARGILSYPVDAVYLDEMGSIPELCYAKDHDHPAFGGDFFARGQRTMCDQIRALPEWDDRRPVLIGECLHEAHIGRLDVLLTAHVDTDPDSVPLYQCIYSDFVEEMGLYMYPDELSMDPFVAKLAFQLVRGRQLGWFNTFLCEKEMDLLLPEHADVMAKLREFCQVRSAGLDFFFDGEMLRPPKVENAGRSPVLWASWMGPGAHQVTTSREVDEVLSGCFKAPDGSIGIILVNRTGTPRKIRVPWNERDWGLHPGDSVSSSNFIRGKWHTATEILPAYLDFELAPYTPLLVKFSRTGDATAEIRPQAALAQ